MSSIESAYLRYKYRYFILAGKILLVHVVLIGAMLLYLHIRRHRPWNPQQIVLLTPDQYERHAYRDQLGDFKLETEAWFQADGSLERLSVTGTPEALDAAWRLVTRKSRFQPQPMEEDTIQPERSGIWYRRSHALCYQVFRPCDPNLFPLETESAEKSDPPSERVK